MTASPFEILAGLLLVFALPGYAITKATFPEWRLRGPDALLHAIEIGTLSLVLSVTVTILVGFVLGSVPGSYFAAGWNDPLLEAVLAAITGVATVAAVLRGGFRGSPPPAPMPEAPPGEAGPFALARALESNRRELRRLRHTLRELKTEDSSRADLEQQIAQLETRDQQLRKDRESEYAT